MASLHIRAEADPQTLPRILGLLSQRWLVPSLFSAQRDGDTLEVQCVVPDLTEHAAAIVAAKLEQIVLVHAVELLAEDTHTTGPALVRSQTHRHPRESGDPSPGLSHFTTVLFAAREGDGSPLSRG